MNDQEKKHGYHPIDFLDSFIKGLENEGDRATVILVASKLELILSQILQKYLIPVPDSEDGLLANGRPLSTFSARIHMAHRLGLIDNLFSRSLHLIRKIRNDFAHEVEGCTLNSGSHRNRVRDLIAPFENLEFFKKLCDSFKKEGKFTLASIQFRAMAAVICTNLEVLFSQCITLSDKDALGLLRVAEDKTSKIIPEAKK
ncbi:hypothetical protein ES708_27118 [subsurface metagenome]